MERQVKLETTETRVEETVDTRVKEAYQKPLLTKHEALRDITGIPTSIQ